MTEELVELDPGISRMLDGFEPLWRDRWPIRAISDCDFDCPRCPAQLACLIGKRREVGPLVFDREFMCNPRSSVSSLFPSEMFEPMLNPELRFEPAVADWLPQIRQDYVIATGWDFALSEKTAADYTAKFTIAFNRETHRRRILEIRRWKGITFDRQLLEIESSYERYQEDVICMETNLFQRLYKNWITQRRRYPVIGHDTGTEKASLEIGVPSLLLALEKELYQIPYAPGLTREAVDVWLAECMAFGWVNDKLQGVAEHDDTVIAWWLSELAIKKTGLGAWGAYRVGISDTIEI